MSERRFTRGAWLALLLTVSLLSASCACGPCGGDGGEGGESGKVGEGKEEAKEAPKAAALAELVPADTDVAVFTPDWQKMVDALDIIEKKFGKNAPIKEGFKDFEKETGLDLTDAKSLKERGLDINGPLGIVYIDEQLLMLLPLADADTFKKGLEKEAKEDEELDPKIHEEKAGNDTIYAMIAKGAKKPAKDNIKFAWMVKGKTALVFPGEDPNTGDGIGLLTDMANLKEAKALSEAKDYKSLKEKLGDGRVLTAYVNVPSLLKQEAKRSPNDAEVMNAIAERTGWLGLGISAEKTGFNAKVFAMGEEKTVKALTKVLSASGDFKNIAGAIDGKPVFILRLSLDQGQLIKELGKIDPNLKSEMDQGLKQAETEVGINFEKDIEPNLDGNYVVTVTGGNAQELMGADAQKLFQNGDVTVAIGVKDAKKLIAALEPLAKKMGAEVAAGDVTVFTLGKGKEGFIMAVGEKVAVLGSGELGEKKLTEMASGNGKGPSGAFSKGVAKELLSGKSGTGVAIDVSRLMKLAGEDAQGPEAEIFKAFSSWALNIKPTSDGLDVAIEVQFK